MKKRNLTFAILLLAVVCTAFGVSGTYARYITQDSGTGTATVAKWAATITGFQESSKTLALTPETSTDVATGKIAPSFTANGLLEFDLTNTEVATDIEFTIGSLTGIPTSGDGSTSAVTLTVKYAKVANSTTTVASDGWTTITPTGGKYTIPMSLTAIGSTPVIKVQVGILWDNASDAHNIDDTYNGENTETITATITATAKQHITSVDGAQSS